MRRILLAAGFALPVLAGFASTAPAQFGPPGGGGGFGGRGGFGGMPTADDMFAKLAQQTGGTDIIDFAKLPADARDRNKRFAQMTGGQPYPESGTMTKDQFTAFFNQNAEIAKAKFAGGGGGFGRPGGFGPPPAPTAAPGTDAPKPPDAKPESDRRDRRDRDRQPDAPAWGQGPPGWGQPGWGQPGWGQGGSASRDTKKEEEETPKPVVFRFGKLPKEVPSWFEKLDTDQDGQIGLYEWRKDGRATAEFVEMDLNGDGYLTAEEWIRHSKMVIEKKPSDSESKSDSKSDDRKKGGNDRGRRNPFGAGK